MHPQNPTAPLAPPRRAPGRSTPTTPGRLAKAGLPAPLRRATDLAEMSNQLATRQMNLATDLMLNAPQLFSAAPLATFGQLQQAVLARWQQWWQNGLQGLQLIGTEYHELRDATTLSRFTVQELNVVGQLFDLAVSQASAALELTENTQVSVGWWLHQGLREVAPAAGPADTATPLPARAGLLGSPGAHVATVGAVGPGAATAARGGPSLTRG